MDNKQRTSELTPQEYNDYTDLADKAFEDGQRARKNGVEQANNAYPAPYPPFNFDSVQCHLRDAWENGWRSADAHMAAGQPIHMLDGSTL